MANQPRIEWNARYIVRGLFVVIVVLLAAVVVYFDIVQPLTQGDAPAAAVRQLCADEVRQDYVAAYALLSSRFIDRYGLNQDQFVRWQQLRDQQHGPVQACAIVGRDYAAALLNTGAAFRVTATLGDSHYTVTGTIQLVNEHGWKISSEGTIDDVLYLAG